MGVLPGVGGSGWGICGEGILVNAEERRRRGGGSGDLGIWINTKDIEEKRLQRKGE